MGIYSILRGKRQELLGSASEKGYEVDYSRPWGDKCDLCGHKLYFAKDSFNGKPIDDIVICSRCGTAYRLVLLLILAERGEKDKKHKDEELLQHRV